MEFYDPNNDNYDPLSGDKKKDKKKPGKGSAWPSIPLVGSPNLADKDQPVPSLFNVPAKDKDKTSQVFFPEQQSETQNAQKELSEEQVKAEFDEIVKGLPELGQKYPPAEAVLPQSSEDFTTPRQEESQVDAARRLAQMAYNENSADSSPTSSEVIYSNQAEPSHRVSGYNREDGEYYSGYVPGAPEKSPDIDGSDGGGNLPPIPPNELGGSLPMPEDVPPSSRPPASASNVVGNINPFKNYEDDVRSAESKGMRRGFVAGAIVAWVVGRHLKNLKLKRERQKFNQEISRHQDEIDTLQVEKTQQQQRESEQERQLKQFEADQRKLKEQLDQKLEAAKTSQPAETLPPVVYKPEHEPAKESQASPALAKPLEKPLKQVGDKEGESHKQQEMIDAALRDIEKAVEEADNKRVEQDAWLRHELDEHGNEIQGQRRGQEYDHERAQELMQHQHQKQPDHKAGAQPIFVGKTAQYQQPVSSQPEISSGQVPIDHRLPYDSRSTNEYYPTSRKQRNPLVTALTSPWTFLMLSIILLAYFIATLL